MHKDKLTVIINVPINESVAIQRIRKYFSDTNYQELYDQMPILKFRRFKKSKNTPLLLVKSFFLGGMAELDVNNRYSLARLVIKPLGDSASVKVSFEEFNEVYETYFSQEILKKEIEFLHKALMENVFEPIKMEHPRRRYMLSELKSILILIVSAILFLGIFMILLSSRATNAEVIMLIISAAIVTGLNLLYSFWRRKRIERKIASNLNGSPVNN